MLPIVTATTQSGRAHYITSHEIGVTPESVSVPKNAVSYKVVVNSDSTASCALHGAWGDGVTPSYAGHTASYITVPPGYSSESQACKYGSNVWLSAQAGVDATIKIDWSIV